MFIMLPNKFNPLQAPCNIDFFFSKSEGSAVPPEVSNVNGCRHWGSYFEGFMKSLPSVATYQYFVCMLSLFFKSKGINL